HRRPCICRRGRSGRLAPRWRQSARRSASSRQSIGGVWTFTRRAGHSTSRGPGAKSGTLRPSRWRTVSNVRITGTGTMAGSDVRAPSIPRAQEQLFAPGKSSRAKYRELVIGRSGWGALVTYELVVLVTQAVPGALGLALRKWLYPVLLGACGRNVV